MTNFDKYYLELVKKILSEGVEVKNRTGINTIKVPSHSFEFDLRREFPILETKQTFFKNAIIEMLWIWQMQSNDVRDLHERNVHIWDEWMVDEDGIYRIYEPKVPGVEYVYDPDREVTVLDPLSVGFDDPFGEITPMKPKLDVDGNVMTAKSVIPGKTIKSAKYFGKDFAYTIGSAYGFITNRYKHTQTLINTIKNNPTDRRMIKSLWQNEFLREAVLPSCVWSTEWDVTNGVLNLHVHQRSCDVPLGLPFNVTQYATFLKMIAQVTGLEAGKISYSIKDAHIYVDQLEGIHEQLRREKTYEEFVRDSSTNLIFRKSKLLSELEFLAKDSLEYKIIDSDIKIIDLILEPSKPVIELDSSIDDFFAFDNSKELKHVKVKNYKHMGRIDMPRAQ